MTVRNQDAHRSFLNRYYGLSRHFYDFTRKYYLLGRDTELSQLLTEDWGSLVEIGPGTGRNLRLLARKRPEADYGGLEASDEMLGHATRLCSVARFQQGFAEGACLESVLGRPPERILFSYCLSMVQDPECALENAKRSLAPGGEIVIVDFADFSGLPRLFAQGLSRWLEAFHVRPTSLSVLRAHGASVEMGRGGYFYRARISAVASAPSSAYP